MKWGCNSDSQILHFPGIYTHLKPEIQPTPINNYITSHTPPIVIKLLPPFFYQNASILPICFIVLHNKINTMSKISIIPHQNIQKHLANNSPSKLSFRFSKTKRFKDNNPECPIAFYSYTSQLSNRKNSIGHAKKIDFLKESETPSSILYNPNSYHEFVKHKGLSFAVSRDQSPDQSYLIPQIHKHPGVGAYDYEKPNPNNSSYSIRPKTMDTIERHLSYKEAPGPGTYDAVELDPTKLRTRVSKFQGPKLGVHLTSPRFSTIKDAPGPHSYIQLDNLSPTARYVVSSRRGRGTRPFTREKRFTHDHWKPSKNPGPHQYEKPSDFGLYGDVKYYRNLSTID